MTDDRVLDAAPSQRVDTRSILLMPFEPEGAAPRILDAARAIGLLGLLMPAGDDDSFELLVAADGDGLRVDRDGRVETAHVEEVLEALRTRCVASVLCLDGDELVAESVMPAALERAEARAAAARPPLVVGTIAAQPPRGISPMEIAAVLRSDVVTVEHGERLVVSARPTRPVVWSPATRPVVLLQHTPAATVVAIWSHHAVRFRQSPLAREAAMLDADVALTWIDDPQHLGGAEASDAARAIEHEIERLHRPVVDAEAREALRVALAELGLEHRVDEVADLAVVARTDDTLDRAIAAFELPADVADVLRERIEPTALPDARVTERRGFLGTVAGVVADELGPDWRDRDRRRRRWLAAVLAPLLAVANVVRALGLIPDGPVPSAWYLAPAAAFAGIAIWAIRWLVLDRSRRAARAAAEATD